MTSQTILENDTPDVKLTKLLSMIVCTLEQYGLDGDVIMKAKVLCPDLIEKAHALENKIDSEFLRLINSKKIEWDSIVHSAIYPYSLAWCDVITAVNGKLKKAGEPR